MIRTSIFAFAFAVIASSAALAGDQPPKVGAPDGGKPAAAAQAYTFVAEAGGERTPRVGDNGRTAAGGGQVAQMAAAVDHGK